jgi:hypothetical protein
MSIFHFRGELAERSPDGARYRFQTDYVSEPSRMGTFSPTIPAWTWNVEESADPRCYPDGTPRDHHCVSALVHKIRKAYVTDGLPDVVFHIA